jgi:hypothetical protein
MAKWSGLGININTDAYNTEGTAAWDSYFAFLKSYGFTDFRLSIYAYNDATLETKNKPAVLRAIADGANVTWGVNNAAGALTHTTYHEFEAGILAAAQWAQDNGVSEFQLGNECEHDLDNVTMNATQFIAHIKETATAVQAIFTRGIVTYAPSTWFIQNWVTAGKGTDIDKLGWNIYANMNTEFIASGNWPTIVNLAYTTWGTDCYISEFSVNSTSLSAYSTDQYKQERKVAEMLDYIKKSGLNRAIFFCWNYTGQDFGVIDNYGDPYKLILNAIAGGRRFFVNV